MTSSLGGHWYGRYGTAPCPICQPERHQRQNALTLSEALDQKLLVHCKKAGCRFKDLAKALGLVPGTFKRANAAELARAEAEARAEAVKRARQALALWRAALPIRGTPAEVYLRGRNLDGASVQDLRFHPAAWRGPSARHGPAMLGFVKGGALPALHRTGIKQDGTGKAKLDPNKAMPGPVKGSAVRLLDGPGPLVVAEGIATALSLACGLRLWPMRLWSAGDGGFVSARPPGLPHHRIRR
ncbi:hypothetical protein NX862_05390 [Rhodobacter sp. KR11]|uniref:DUF7146 domain-containing protein n=1 Tax=Rhodobacter sp. KR11 TaxID=2974588 RepID=UPI002222C63A|nr:hypothetical protein [Rhodobacter sp. KR11]MCW1918180.1 hypothetical protein [Rhodobacter sp. KR11]